MGSSVTINGQKGAYFQPARFGRTESGDYIVWEWEGTRQECLSKVPGILGSGGTYDYQQSVTGAKDKITARFAAGIAGQPEVPVETWELTMAPFDKALLMVETLSLAGLTKDEKDSLRELAANPGSQPTLSFFPGSNADELQKLLLSGVTSKIIYVPTLHHTMTVSNQYKIKASQTNVGKIIKTSSLPTLEEFPTDEVLFELPNDTDPAVVASLPEVHYGWLKNGPEIRRSARNRLSVDQSWSYGLWSKFLYGLPV